MIIDKIKIGTETYDIGATYSNIADTPTKLSDFTNDEGFIDKEVSDLTNYTPSSETTSQLELVLNSDDFKLKGILKDSEGNTIYTSNEIDLPLESTVVDGTYDSANKEVVLTLVSGSTIRFSVADLINGLVSSTDLATALENYYTKNQIDAFLLNKQDNLVAGDNITIDGNTISASGGESEYIIYHTDSNDRKKEIGQKIYDEYKSTGKVLNVSFKNNSQETGAVKLTSITKDPYDTNKMILFFGSGIWSETAYNSAKIFIPYGSITLSNDIVTNATFGNGYSSTPEALGLLYQGQGANYNRYALSTSNTYSYTPTSDYNPATKKYVDDTIASASVQYSTMPEASESTLGKIVQYTGETTEDYTNGYFYKSTFDEESETYIWENIQVQEGGGAEQPEGYLCIILTLLNILLHIKHLTLVINQQVII